MRCCIVDEQRRTPRPKTISQSSRSQHYCVCRVMVINVVHFIISHRLVLVSRWNRRTVLRWILSVIMVAIQIL